MSTTSVPTSDGIVSDISAPINGLLDLPPEIHDHIFSYLDWDRTQNLLPKRNDILKISITCKHLRRSVIPTLFQHVTLRLRWAQDVLLEPTLFRLRNHLPHLARHVQTVTINAEYEPMDQALSWVYLNRCEADEISESWNQYQRRIKCLDALPIFVTGARPEDWLHPSHSIADEEQPTTRYVERVEQVYADMVSQFDTAVPKLTWTADEQNERRRLHYEAEQRRYDRTLALAKQGLAINDRIQMASSSDDQQADDTGKLVSPDLSVSNKAGRIRLQLHALALAASCIPSTVTRLIVHAVPAFGQATAEHNFALATAAAAMRLIGPGLSEATIDIADSSSRIPRRLTVVENTHITADTVECLSKLQVLRIGNLGDSRTSLQRKLECWTRIPLQTLELWNYTADSTALFDLLAKIPAPKELHFRRLVVQQHFDRAFRTRQNLGHAGPAGPAGTVGAITTWPNVGNDSDQDDFTVTYLLHFAIGVREALPDTFFSMDLVSYATPGAQAFIHAHVAGNPGQLGEGRRQRLLQDFKYFSPMWKAEADAQPRVEDEKQFAGLIDAAMFARSKYQWA